jgi:uncharacterized SAM-binding protein YcdF (DUF218 family)
VLALAQTLFDYLTVRSSNLDRADVIIGFGHFDPKIPARCYDLYRKGYASRLLFTGGMGAGTADLRQPEALYFRDEVKRLYPEIPEGALVLEAESTHTGENVLYSLRCLQEIGVGSGLTQVILVANAYRQRRVWLTWQRHAPSVSAFNAPPSTTFETEQAMFAEKGQDLIGFMIGEVDRIRRYADLGYIVRVKVPGEIMRACDHLRDLGYGSDV